MRMLAVLIVSLALGLGVGYAAKYANAKLMDRAIATFDVVNR